MKNKNTKLIVWLFTITIAMFGFGYALVPLYNVFCQLTGLNGKPTNLVTQSSVYIDSSRWITVQFDANNNASLPWKFYPVTRKIKIHPGENQRIIYYAENISDHAMTVQAVPSVTPGIAAKYLKKTECFCFTQQTLKAGEGLNMPMIFHIDPDLPQNINVLTLSYTLFDVTHMKKNVNKTPGKL